MFDSTEAAHVDRRGGSPDLALPGSGFNPSPYYVLVTTAGVEGFLVGIFVVLCTTALYLLIHRPPNRPHFGNGDTRSKLGRITRGPKVVLRSFARPMVFGSVLLLLMAVGHWICTMVRVLTTVSLITRKISPVHFLQDASHPLLATMSFFLTGAVFMADSLLIRRLWIVSHKKRWIVAPPMLACLTLVCGLRAGTYFARAHGGDTIHSDAFCTRGVHCDWALTGYSGSELHEFVLFDLSICIYKIQARTISQDQKKIRSIPVIIIESAAIWSLRSLFVFINYYLNPSSVF
ncbi:hypothetical protein CC2G_007617 [Coprinopsis cinerea AmutBmut pab1-1]|nr:hypothetical protein CC2G_007617 [Coprinopsis cinerea AmutBmut pab1-1]